MTSWNAALRAAKGTPPPVQRGRAFERADSRAAAAPSGHAAAALLQVDGVSLEYRTPERLVRATQRVSFDLFPSDRFVLLGPSGCGKSTLLKAVGGFIAPVEGEIRLDGRPVQGPGPDRIVVFQEFDQLPPWKTVRQNVMFPLLAGRTLARNEAEERAMHYLEKVGLADFADVHPHQLSGGMKQRVAIARALAMQPRVLLMDEPFAALDALTRRRMQDELLRLWDEVRFTLLFVTHSIEEALVVGNRIALLSPHPGRMRAEINSHGFSLQSQGSEEFQAAARRIHGLLFEEEPVQTEQMEQTAPAAGDPREMCEMCEMDEPPADHRAGAPVRADAGARSGPVPTEPPVRPEYELPLEASTALPAEQALPLGSRLWNQSWLRKGSILLVMAVLWELIARWQDNDLLLPTFSATARALVAGLVSGELLAKVGISLAVLLQGYAAGVLLAFMLTMLAVSTRLGRDLLSTLTSMFNPLPAIALLPLALLWFGLGRGSLVFVLIHSVLWPLALNTYAGFQGVPETLRMAGRNYGLRGLRYVLQILVPAALPAILSGLKIGWAFAWRTLIAAELVFGASSGQGGLGWYIFQNRNELYTDRVFAGLAMVVLIGLAVESLGFATLERLTVRKWGQQR